MRGRGSLFDALACGPADGALSRPDVAEGALSGARVAQGVEIALSGRDRADAAGDGPALTRDDGRLAARGHGDVPATGVVSGVNRQVSAVPGCRGRAPGARILGSGAFTGPMVLHLGPLGLFC